MTTVAEREDRLTSLEEEVAFIASELREQRRRREAWDELRTDLAPIAGDVFAIAGDRLHDASLPSGDDVVRLLTRLGRNVNNIEALLAKMESALQFVDDASPIVGEAVMRTTRALGELDDKGYFGFARSSLGVVDRVVTSFTQDDVDLLGDNIVLILQTVKEMTQPEVMRMLQRTAHVLEEDVEAPTTFALLRQMRDPEVKRGLARMLRVLRSLSEGARDQENEGETK